MSTCTVLHFFPLWNHKGLTFIFCANGILVQWGSKHSGGKDLPHGSSCGPYLFSCSAATCPCFPWSPGGIFHFKMTSSFHPNYWLFTNCQLVSQGKHCRTPLPITLPRLAQNFCALPRASCACWDALIHFLNAIKMTLRSASLSSGLGNDFKLFSSKQSFARVRG